MKLCLFVIVCFTLFWADTPTFDKEPIKWTSGQIEKEKIDDYYINKIHQSFINITKEMSIRAKKQACENQKNFKTLKFKKTTAKCLFFVAVFMPIFIILFSAFHWESETRKFLNEHISHRLYSSQQENSATWNKIGGIANFTIGKIRIYKCGYFDVYVEAQIKYYIGNNNADAKDVTKIVDHIYEDVQIPMPAHLSTGSNNGEFAPWPWKIVAQKPNGEIITVDNVNCAIHSYGKTYENGKSISIFWSVPLLILYLLILGFALFCLRSYINELNTNYYKCLKQDIC